MGIFRNALFMFILLNRETEMWKWWFSLHSAPELLCCCS